MTEPMISDRLRATALCETEHPGDAATALIVAAVAILAVRFSPTGICVMIDAAMREALGMAGETPAAGRA